MSATLLPPRRVFALTALLFDSGLEPHLLPLMALAWASPISPSRSYARWACPQLSRLTGKSPTTIHGHLDVLRTYRSALRLRNAGHGLFIACLGDWLYTVRKTGSYGFPDSAVNDKNR